MAFDIRQEVVHSLAQAVRRGGHSLGNVPGLLRRVIEENMWQRRQFGEQEIELAEFRAFVETEFPEGLGTTIKTLEALCQHEPDLMAYLVAAKRGKHGGARLKKTGESEFTVDARGNVVEKSKYDNITLENKPPTGTSAEYAYHRLRVEAYNEDGTVKNKKVAKIHQRVISGEIKPHAGMVEAGFRVHKVAVNMTDPESAARTITKYMDVDNVREFVRLLQKWLNE
jgi:hypothetical protein